MMYEDHVLMRLRFYGCLRSAPEAGEDKRCVKGVESDEKAVYRRRRRRTEGASGRDGGGGSECSVKPQSDSEHSDEPDCDLTLFS